jgi:hypothetical protein
MSRPPDPREFEAAAQHLRDLIQYVEHQLQGPLTPAQEKWALKVWGHLVELMILSQHKP